MAKCSLAPVCCTLAVVSVSAFLCSCVSTHAGTLSDARTASARPPVMRNVLVWQTGSLLAWPPLSSLDINVLHTQPTPVPDDNLSPHGLKPLSIIKEAIDKQWRDEVAQMHKRGVRVWATVASTYFVPERFRKHGLNPEIYLARDPEGQPSMMLGGSFGKEQMTSCYNNPHWLDLLRGTVLAYEDAGFDGIWFDVGGYADPPVFFCHCEYCRRDWKAYAKQVGLPDDTVQPTKDGGRDFTKRVNREHFRWRLQVWDTNFRAIRGAVKIKNPSFTFLHNAAALSEGDYFVGVTHLYDLPHLEEWGHSAAPYSLLPTYLLGKAYADNVPPVLVQNDNPPRNEIQHRVALAEAYAAGGVLQNRNFPDENQRFYKYLKAYENLYVGQKSMAKVAVATSFWSRYLYEVGEKPWDGAPRPQYWMGWMLQDLHIPYDYLFVEKSFTVEDLQRYRLLILSDLAVFDDKQLAVLHEYLERGGRILATHNTAKYDLEMQDRGRKGLATIAGKPFDDDEQLRVGSGRWVYLPSNPADDYNKANPRNASAKTVLSPPKAAPSSVTKALDWLLEDVLPVTVEAKNTTAIVPQRQKGRILLHLVNYNMYPDGQTLTPDEHVRVRVELPETTSIRSVRALSPDWDGYEKNVQVKRDGAHATVTLDKLDAYALIVLELVNDK